MALSLAKIPIIKKRGGNFSPKRTEFSAARGSRFAIFLGDEGAILVHLKDKNVLSRHFIPDISEENFKVFSDILMVDISAPIYLIIDSMDQAFVQQTLPPVSSLSVGKLINRRLNRDFGANDIKGSLLLGREKTGRKDWNFLMVSVERTKALSEWLDFIGGNSNPFAGVLLLSVETERVWMHFESALDLPKENVQSQWKFFISHNKVGGFRQVILKNGRIIFTRMTQPIGESTPEVIAGNIEQEASSTIEYMKRLGFAPQAGLDMYVITSNAVRTVLDLSRFEARVSHVMTPFEAAQTLGITGATQQGDQYGDVVLAACVAADKKHVLLLSIPQFQSIERLEQALKYQRVVAAISIVGMVGYSGVIGSDFYVSYQKGNELISQRNEEQNKLDSIKAEIKSSSLDVEKVSEVIDLYKEIKSQRFSPVPMIARMEGIARQPVSVKSIEWTLDDGAKGKSAPPRPTRAANVAGGGAPRASSGQLMVMTLTLEFKDPGKKLDILKTQSEEVMAFFKTTFPDYSVDYVKPVIAPTKDSESVNITFEPKKDNKETAEVIVDNNKIIEAQIVIRGDVMTHEAAMAVDKISDLSTVPAALPPAMMVSPAGAPVLPPADSKVSP